MSKKRQYGRDMLRPAIRQAGGNRGVPFTDDEFEQVLDAYEQGDVGAASTMIKWLTQVPLVYQAHQRRLAPLRSVSAAYKAAQIPSHLRKDDTDGLSRKSTQAPARRTPQPPDPRGDGGAEEGVGLYEYLNVTSAIYYPVQQHGYNSQLARAVGQFLIPNGSGLGGIIHNSYLPEPEHQSLPVEVNAGELVAWRCWRKGWSEDARGNRLADRLTSMSMDTEWKVGETVEGNPTLPNQGVHAWKTEAKAREYARGEYCDIAIGTVELWGTVIEHEDGYRAQYGAIKEIVDTVPAHPHATQYVNTPLGRAAVRVNAPPGSISMIVPPEDGEGLSAVILGIVLGTTALLSLLVLATKLWG